MHVASGQIAYECVRERQQKHGISGTMASVIGILSPDEILQDVIFGANHWPVARDIERFAFIF